MLMHECVCLLVLSQRCTSCCFNQKHTAFQEQQSEGICGRVERLAEKLSGGGEASIFVVVDLGLAYSAT